MTRGCMIVPRIPFGEIERHQVAGHIERAAIVQLTIEELHEIPIAVATDLNIKSVEQ